MRKNQPLVPRPNIAGSWTPGGGGVPTMQKALTLYKGWVKATKKRLSSALNAISSAALHMGLPQY